MKILTRKETNIALYLFEDAEVITFTEGKTHVGKPLKYIIQDCNLETCNFYENITNVPDEWQPWKYQFDGTTWTEDEAFKNWEADDLPEEEDIEGGGE